MSNNVVPLRPSGSGGLPTGGGSGYDGTMPPSLEARVNTLETKVSEIASDMKTVVKDVAEIKGKLSNMPTTFQLLSWQIGISIGLVALVATIVRAAVK
jgi:hypothetical protein